MPVGKVMRACVRVILLTISAALAGCSSVDHQGDVTNSVFANGKLPVEPTPPVHPEAMRSESRALEPTAIEEETERPAKKPHQAARRPQSAQTSEPEPRETWQASAPTTTPPAKAAPAAPARATPPAATPAPAVASPTTSVPAAPASVPLAASQTTPSSAASAPRASSQAESKRLNTPWPEAPTSETFSH
jgi:hypothetical protein